MPKNYILKGQARIDENGNKFTKVPSICWFTNLEHNKRSENLFLYREYSESRYPKYDNYDAINVDKVAEIPVNYWGYMGVPITFIGSYSPDQFEIIGMDRPLIEELTGRVKRFYLNKKELYARVVIRHRKG